ncbi:UNVERIFIED_CONTAM: Serpin-ZXA [Sesamum radiatum]|uniref:Serpin-ZXA n=1 Tax=Sesamum radiatum TaxID=300843 RepID=A0AAW2VPW4_SESRA
MGFNSSFCLGIANLVLQEEAEKGSNSVLSPLSFQVLLSLVAAGSGGRTLEQFLFHLGSENVDNLKLLSSKLVALLSVRRDDTNLAAGPLVSFANGTWVDRSLGLRFTFQSMAEEVFKAQVKGVDFANKVGTVACVRMIHQDDCFSTDSSKFLLVFFKADDVRDEVNSWAESITGGLIKEILPLGSLNQDTALVLANALYFKGAWNRIFDTTRTKTMNFQLLNGEEVWVPFMTSRYNEKHLYRGNDEYKILQIPYQNGQDMRKFSMYFFLPEKTDGLQNLVQSFHSNPELFSQDFDLREEELSEFWIPRFKFSYEFEASRIVRNLGLDLPFTNLAEFNEMVDPPCSNRLCISKIFHKSFIEVNEEGTEAAASTAATFVLFCATFPTASFVADHPFIFMVREEASKVVFFTGAVLNPLEQLTRSS